MSSGFKLRLFMILVATLSCGLVFAHYTLDTDKAAQEYISRFTETNPPTGAVRPVGEFEPASHVLIRYPLGIPVNLVAQLSNTAQVICIVSSTSVQNQATSAFSSGGVNMANVSFMIAATDSYWTRDYGPWFIYNNDDLAVVDFQYNRPRPNDNMIPQTFATNQGYVYYGMNLQQTGGNYMSDGINTAAQTTIAYDENSSLTHAQVDLKMQQYLGITNYYVIQDPNNTYIDHIDCWGKFLAPDKVLIRSVPTSHAQYDEIEQVASFFAQTNCAWGYPYKVYRVNTPGNQPYTNSLILNKKVFVPIMGVSYDNAALEAYRQALPGYEVIGFTGLSSAPWESTDALHCRTHEVPDKDVLYIGHTPLHGIQNGQTFSLNAVVHPYSQMQVYADSVFVSYKVNQGSWQRSLLTHLTGFDYTTTLTGFAQGDTIRYFIHAADQSGRSNNHPLTASYDPHLFIMSPDSTPPVIQHTDLSGITNQPEPVVFNALITDESGVNQAFFRYQIDGGSVFEYPMDYLGDNIWTYSYVPEFETGNINFYYQFRAVDNSSQHNQAYYPSSTQWVQCPITIVANDDEINSPVVPAFRAVYPNPFTPARKGSLYLDYNCAKNTEVTVNIFNLKGQKIFETNRVAELDGNNFLSLDNTASNRIFSTSGIYLVRMQIANRMLIKKIAVSM